MHHRLLLTLAVWLLASTSLLAADPKAKILLVGKDLDHPSKTHTYISDCELLAKCLRQTEGVETVVSNGWPKDPAVVKNVTAIVLHTRLGGTVLFRGPQRAQVEELVKRGVGITAIHWGTGAETPEGGPWLQAMGGWFNAEGDGFSRYLVQSSKLRQVDPKHPICRGWSDFDLREEYYFKLCFLPEARPVMTTVIEGTTYPIAWVYERPHTKDGRSFGFVGGHFHDNFGIPEFRQAVVNGILWTAHLDIPEKGAPILLTSKDMELPPEDPKKKSAWPSAGEAVEQLGWSRRTLLRWLEPLRERLPTQFERHGVAGLVLGTLVVPWGLLAVFPPTREFGGSNAPRAANKR